MLPVQVSMDVTSLYTNIPEEEGITIICKAYETFYRNEPPIPSQYLEVKWSEVLILCDKQQDIGS